ncbi:restriction endonuclease subunit S [Lactiplantibacillus plantarum]|uniref:restriction endonuclease subunit S n=1 Tax=Lactiplantibacillus plantarum TaxID=1590 RepID=UPI0021A4234C|nr:restriction endonuclease subunit S [Lactiplantibacillus plantarum]MCT3245969.1 restriction endonuclease subunit S [Lactiplantibacillus plantarum]
MAKIDDSVKKKVPELRFKGFTDPWVQRNLADLSDGFSYGLNAAAKEYDGVHGYLRITDIDEVSHSFLPEGLTSPDVPEDQLTDYRMDEQSIVYARTGASTGKTYIYRDSDGELYYAGFLIRQKVNKETSAQFVYQNTLTKAWERYVQVMSQRSGQPGINAQEVGRFELAIPERAEQDKIAHLFNSLDNLIAANQRKLDLLKEQKKGYLQKMFPKNGAKVPELRFAGFADDWEERKLGNELTLLKDGTHGTHQNVLEGPFLLSAKNIKNGKIIIDEITDRKISVEEYNSIHKKFSLEKGDVLLTIVGSIGETAIIENPIGITFQRSVAYLRPSHTILSQFLFTTINGQKFQMELRKRQVVSAQPGIYLGDLSIIPILIPSVAEQEKIGSFFKQLDETIALHQRKLDLLKEQKKGFLQNMFV